MTFLVFFVARLTVFSCFLLNLSKSRIRPSNLRILDLHWMWPIGICTLVGFLPNLYACRAVFCICGGAPIVVEPWFGANWFLWLRGVGGGWGLWGQHFPRTCCSYLCTTEVYYRTAYYESAMINMLCKSHKPSRRTLLLNYVRWHFEGSSSEFAKGSVSITIEPRQHKMAIMSLSDRY